MTDASGADPNAVDAPADVEDAVEDEPAADDAEDVVAPPPTEVVLDTGDAALTVSEASQLAAELGATVIVVAGAQAVGKTTMAVTLWSQFLHGPFAGFRFAGSRSLDAFDRRQFASRVSSGNARAEMGRTEDEDIRLLHLRLADEKGCLADLMPTDIKGEFFEDLINGRPAADGLQRLVQRADKVIVAIDGEKVAALEERQAAVLEAELLIGRLTDGGWMHPDSTLLLLLTKRDLVNVAEVQTWYDERAEGLVKFAIDRGLTSVTSSYLSARSNPEGFDDLLRWMHVSVQRRRCVPVPVPTPGRVFVSGVVA